MNERDLEADLDWMKKRDLPADMDWMKNASSDHAKELEVAVHALKRAIEAEAKLEKAKDLIQRWFDGEISAFDVMDSMIIDLEFDVGGIPDGDCLTHLMPSLILQLMFAPKNIMLS